MTNGWVFLQQYLQAVFYFFLNPLFYIFVLFIYLQYRKQMAMERQLFAVRIHSPFLQTLRSVGLGLVGGMFVSLAAGALGIVVQAGDLWIVWAISIVLICFRVRFLCFAYAVGGLTLLQGLALLWPAGVSVQGIGTVWSWILASKPVPLLAVVALMHFAEAVLIRWNGGRDASPLYLEGKRGKIIGAYHLQSFWLTPLLLLVPMQANSGLALQLFSGWPLFSPGLASSVYGLLLIPAVTGFSDMTQTVTPDQKARETAGPLGLYSLVLLLLAYAAVHVPALSIAAALFAIIGHEGLFRFSQRREQKHAPFFIQSSRGVKVMAVIPGTPAEEMGILCGEVIVKVNGIPVRDRTELYTALQANPAYCKMEVLTYNKEPKFVQCAIYAGNHHQLGIIVVPDSETKYYVDVRRLNLVRLLKQRIGKIKLGA
ncbi:PDZ domain-containing protein [Brevibacillus massiliensis]|uniref:PDZ domain-containing protein n=1 Tax=Brevibacillus massiliensis TaxID=1118054 RepID=UPI0002F0BA68|nr:PDZ domain-containing protein [Brevibacillus massiliensis]